jgi:hypothetical protein
MQAQEEYTMTVTASSTAPMMQLTLFSNREAYRKANAPVASGVYVRTAERPASLFYHCATCRKPTTYCVCERQGGAA